MAHNEPLSRNEALLQNALGESHEIGAPQSRIEELLQELVAAIQAGGGTASGVAYLTTAPTANNPDDDLKFVVLSDEPAQKYNGYVYFITGGS